MRKILKFTVIVLFWISIIHAAKVLVIVESNYYNNSDNGGALIDDYIALVRAKDGYDVELISNFQATTAQNMVEQCRLLWEIIADEYQAEEIEGAVLVGDLPIPIFYQHQDFPILPVDYLYMDVCDERVGGIKYPKLFDSPGIPDIGVWKTNAYYLGGEESVYFDWIKGPDGYNGDGIADIWVSRIYAGGLHALREDGAPWGDFLEEYEILDAYFRRVIKRMTSKAEVPPRALAMGYPHHYNNTSQQNLEHLLNTHGNGPAEQIRRILYPNNAPEIYQTQMQNGPYGGYSRGAVSGNKFPDGCKIISTFPEYEGDTRGYESACLYVHSNGNQHGWHGSHNNLGKTESHGLTSSILTCIPWTLQTGAIIPGFEGASCTKDWFKTEESYFKVSNEFIEGMNVRPAQSESNYFFNTFQMPLGDYEFKASMFIPDNGILQKFDTVYINIYVNYPAYFYKLPDNSEIRNVGWAIPIPAGTDGWIQIWNNYNTIKDLDRTNWILISITPYYWDEIPDEIVPCDAVKLEMISPSSQEWYEDNPADMHLMKPHNYRTARSTASMRDDEGPSKAKFTFMNACQPNNFLVRHNIGNMYALDHNGLISVGRPTTCFGTSFPEMYEGLKNGDSFGKAFLDNINNEDGFPSTAFPSTTSTQCIMALLGAGTLKYNAYLPYIDATQAVFSNDIHTKWSYWIARSAEVTDMKLYYESGQDYDPELNIFAGSEIVVRPGINGVTFCRGSKVNLKINPELLSSE